jgi:GT2 family glycosyltransferase
MCRVAIIVLNWNGRADTLACLASLAGVNDPTCEVVVVDNGSTDDSVAAVRASYSQVALIETGENLGYVGGNNVGLEYARTMGADYALLLNNDTEVAPDFLRLLVEAAEANPATGIVGPTIYYFDRPGVIWSAGGAIDWGRGRTFMIGLDEVDQGQFGHTVRLVDFVTGCALLIKMSVVERVGMLDPRFFAYYEEAEWCVRVARAGFRILHVPQAKIWHKITPSARAGSPAVHYYMTRNRLLFLKVTGAGPKAWFHTLVAEYLRTLISWSVKARWRHKHLQRSAMIQAIADARRGRWGRRATMWGGT